MIPIRVISLRDARLRRQHVWTLLRQQDLPFRFFDALGSDTGPDTFDAICEDDFVLSTGRQALETEIACFASHRALWQLCRRENTPMLIMEDDFRLDPGFREAVEQVASLIGLFGLMRLQSERRARRTLQITVGNFEVWRYTKPPQSTLCYAVSPAVAECLIRASRRCCEPVDVFMRKCWKHRCPMYGLLPYTVSEHEIADNSMIGRRSKARKSPAVRIRRIGGNIYGRLRQALFNFRRPVCRDRALRL